MVTVSSLCAPPPVEAMDPVESERGRRSLREEEVVEGERIAQPSSPSSSTPSRPGAGGLLARSFYTHRRGGRK